VTLTAAIVAFTNAIMFAAINFGLSLSENQRASVVGVVNASLILGALVYDQARGIKKSSMPTSANNPPGP
jgi:uncharacterized membrane protein